MVGQEPAHVASDATEPAVEERVQVLAHDLAEWPGLDVDVEPGLVLADLGRVPARSHDELQWERPHLHRRVERATHIGGQSFVTRLRAEADVRVFLGEPSQDGELARAPAARRRRLREPGDQRGAERLAQARERRQHLRTDDAPRLAQRAREAAGDIDGVSVREEYHETGAHAGAERSGEQVPSCVAMQRDAARRERRQQVGEFGGQETAAEVLWVEADGTEIDVERGRVLDHRPVRDREIRLRVFVDEGRCGVATGPEPDRALVEAALARAAHAEPNPHAGPAPRPATVPLGLGIDDRRWAGIGFADRAEVALAAESGVVRGDRRARAQRFRYADARVRRRFGSTRSVFLEEWSTRYRAEGSVEFAEAGSGFVLQDGVEGRSFSTMSALPFGQTLAERGGRLLGPTADVEGPIRVAIPAVEVARIFARIGEGLCRGGFASLRSLTLDPRVHLLDDGGLPGSLRSSAFDDRGCVPRPLVLIREGRVGRPALGPEDARRLDVAPTGHVHDDALRPNNLYMRGGTRTSNAVLLETDRPVLHLDHLRGVDEGLDEATGEMSLRAWGWLGHGAKRAQPVRDLRLRGTLSGVFGKLAELCSDTDRLGHVDAAAMIVDGFVAG